MKSVMQRWALRRAIGLAATVCIGITLAARGPCPVASADVSGSLTDWAAAVCLDGRAVRTQRPHTINGYQCWAPGRYFYINFDQFPDEATMNMVLNVSGNISWTKTTIDGYPFVIWSPEGGDRLAPLKKYGFSVTASTPRTAQPAAPPAVNSTDVPGATRGVTQGDPCTNYRKFAFGFGKDGSPFICGSDGVSDKGTWVRSQPIAGVKDVGTSCNPSFTAQAPDGRPMICGDRGWTPTVGGR